jgi:predicted transcriptional regulator
MDLEPLEVISGRIRRARKAIGISQKRLASLAGLSQGEIARLERDPKRLNPSYNTIFTIIFALNSYNHRTEGEGGMDRRAFEIMHRKICYVKRNDTVSKAIDIMRKNDFSQLPVLTDERRVVGTVYQKGLLTFATDRNRDIKRTRVGEIMEGNLPQVDRNTTLGKIKPILENWDAVLITENDRVTGIITVYDLFKIV